MLSHSAVEYESAKPFFYAKSLVRQYAQCGYRLDIFPTDTGGAAICLRYGTPGAKRTLVYDGGTAATGNAIVDYIREQYGTDVVHDLVCSHPGEDAINGAFSIFDGLKVERLWMHRPWLHSHRLARFFASGFEVDAALDKHYREAFAMTLALEEVAFERDVPIYEPFQAQPIGPMVVMSPHRDWYWHRLILDFEDPPHAKRSMSHELARLLRMPGLIQSESDNSGHQESLENESLTEWGEVTAEMESSVVLYGAIAGEGILLTGNAGIKALSNAAAFAERERLFVPSNLKFFQVPNRGDANHLSPSVLDRLVGPKLPSSARRSQVNAFVATSPQRRGLPHETVVNALYRRGASVFQVNSGVHDCRGLLVSEVGMPREITPTWARRHD